jgi:hypothetical protein
MRREKAMRISPPAVVTWRSSNIGPGERLLVARFDSRGFFGLKYLLGSFADHLLSRYAPKALAGAVH